MADIPTGTVTFLFTDIEGSTSMWENHPRQMEAALKRHDEILRSAVEGHGGYVFKMIGDACCAAFDTAKDALEATLAAQRALLAERWGENIKVRVRAALHTGLAEERDGDYFGPPVNRVARLMGAGHGGQVLVSDATYNLVRDHLVHLEPGAELRFLGEHRLRDLRYTERIFQLVVPDLPEEFPALKTHGVVTPAQGLAGPGESGTSSGEDRYSRKGTLGSGGMAEVYLARDEVLDRDVALKVLSRQYANDEQFVERFEREAKSAAGLAHPNIVSIYDRGKTRDGAYYMVMECVTGGSLKDRILKEGPLPAGAALELTLQIARALEAAHEEGIIHRDIKPQNVLLSRRGEAKVADFGIAKAASWASSTATGMIMGTPHYMSPEQVMGESATPRSDLYSLGVVLYEMLTGELPYYAETPMGILSKHLRGQLRPPKEVNPNVPERANAVCMRLLAREPEDRYPDAAALVEELKRALEGSPPTPPIPEKTVRVPDLIGKSVSLASSTLANGGLTLGDQKEVPNDTIPKGGIFRQRPEPGTEVEPGSSVRVTVSSGPSIVEVPNLAGLNRSEVSSTLVAVGLKLGARYKAPNDDAPEGEIIGQSPGAGTEASPGSFVSVTVSTGPEVSEPDLSDQRTREAEQALSSEEPTGPEERDSRRVVASYGSRAEAQRAVGYLYEEKFPVERVSIVEDPQFVEQVTEKRYGKAALRGAGYGAVVGVVFLVLLGIL